MMKQRQKPKTVNYTRILDKHSDSSDGEETELFKIKPTQQPKPLPSVEKEIEDGDSLQSLAVKYHCTIADLKRLNNVQNDNEIFAKRTIKVPYRPITMALAGIHLSGKSSPGCDSSPAENLDEFHRKLKENLELQIPSTPENQEVNNIIFNSVIQKQPSEDLDLLEQLDEQDDCEDVYLLPSSSGQQTQDPIVSKINCSGTDGDISWIALIVCTCLIIVIVPLVYVFFLAEGVELTGHHHHS